jgi:hypothetical protein
VNACLLRLTGDRTLRERLGEAAADVVRTRFELQKQVEQLEDFYDEAIRNLVHHLIYTGDAALAWHPGKQTESDEISRRQRPVPM